MADKNRHENSGFSLRSAFREAAVFVGGNKLQSTALATSLLLGTTALATPLMTGAAGAAAVLAGSILLLIQNSRTVIENTVGLGAKLGLSTAALGIALGSLNTIPEVSVALGAVWHGATELGIGNVVGSNIVHNLLILGGTGALAGIARPKDHSWRFNALVMTGTSVAFGAQLAYGTLSPWVGAAMLGFAAWYLKRHFFTGHDHQEQEHVHHHEHGHECDHNHNHEHQHAHDHSHGNAAGITRAHGRPRWLNLVLASTALLALWASADLLVQSGVALADKFNIAVAGGAIGLSQAAVGAVVVAIGAAIPEIMINLEAIRSRQTDMAVGNILGCGIINGLVAGGALCLTGAAVPAAFRPDTLMGLVNIGAFVGSAGVLTATLLATKGAMTRWQGGLAVAAYAGYLAAALTLGNGDTPTLHQHGNAEEHMQIRQPASATQPLIAPR